MMTNRAIEKMWTVFAVGENRMLELRALWPKGLGNKRKPVVKHFSAADYPSVDNRKVAFENAALELNLEGYNIYIVMNPIRPDYDSDGAVGDTGIDYRDLLLIDIDRTGDTTHPATDVELEAARELAMVVRKYLQSLGWGMPFLVMSGNGYHLYYILDGVENTPETRDMVAGVLHDLASRFDNSVVGIDKAVFNASRITKVPGTVMRKGQETPERPYRVAEVCDE
jgi:hypothetical protein